MFDGTETQAQLLSLSQTIEAAVDELNRLKHHPDVSSRELSVAATELETANLWLRYALPDALAKKPA